MTNFTFPKNEKLKSRKLISEIFTSGETTKAYPLLARYVLNTQNEIDSTIMFGVSVPKRRFKKAVDRNRIKRLVKEAYRLQKHHLQEVLDQNHLSMAVMVVFTGDEVLQFADINKAVQKLIYRLVKSQYKNN